MVSSVKVCRLNIGIAFFFFFSSLLYGQDFSFILTEDSLAIDTPKSELVVYSTLTNLSSVKDIEIDIIRMQENLPSNWQTSICVDVCLPPTIDSTRLYLYAGQSQTFTFHFYTSINNDVGNATVIFRNVYNSLEVYSQTFYGKTDSSYVADLKEQKYTLPFIKIYPNPCVSYLYIDMNDALPTTEFTIVDQLGRIVYRKPFQPIINVKQLPIGCYSLLVSNGSTKQSFLFIKEE